MTSRTYSVGYRKKIFLYVMTALALGVGLANLIHRTMKLLSTTRTLYVR